MFWKRKSKKVTPAPEYHPQTADEMRDIADVHQTRITLEFFNAILKEITIQSLGGNKAWAIPEDIWDRASTGVSVWEAENLTNQFAWVQHHTIRPNINFKLLRELLEKNGFTVTSRVNGRITTIFWDRKYEN